MNGRSVRTTLTLPADLLEAVDRAVREGRARSRNALVVGALRHELATQERAAIDAAFAEMVDDLSHQSEATRIAEEFAEADQETLRIAEAGR